MLGDELDGSDLAPDDSVLMKQSFTTRVEEASTGEALLELIGLLPNNAQKYGHSITMNAVIKKIARAPVFRDETACLYTAKQKNGHEVKVSLTFSALSKDTQAFVKNLIKRLKPDYGPRFEVLQVLTNSAVVFDYTNATARKAGMP
jgi:hypothetical protein